MESEQYCAIKSHEAKLRGAVCGVLPPCGDKECEFGFKRNENNCQDTCDCVEDDERFLMDDIIIREEVKPFVLKKVQVIYVDNDYTLYYINTQLEILIMDNFRGRVEHKPV